MELKQLKYFVAVAEERHFGRAALRVHISQPPLSMQIKNLENELGVRLFNRTSRRVDLTDAGVVFLEHARDVLNRIDQMTRQVCDAGKGKAGTLVVGFIGPAMDAFLPRIIRRFRESSPRIVLALHEMSTRAQMEALRSDTIHIGFIRLFNQEFDDLAAEPVFSEPYVLALPDDHPLAGEKCISLKRLKDAPFIMYPRQTHPPLYDCMITAFQNAGFNPNIVQDAVTKKTTVALVAAGIGLAVVPDSSKNIRQDGIVFRPIDDPLPVVEIAVVRKKGNNSLLLESFLKTAQELKQE